MRFSVNTFVVPAVLLCLAIPSAVEAAYTSAASANVANMTGGAGFDFLVISSSGGVFRHNRFAAGDPGFASDADFDTTVAGSQTIDAATGVINIDAAGGDDTIVLANGIDLRGTIDGGAGDDKIDYAAFTTAVVANLGLGTTGLSATLGPNQQVPVTTSTATGTATVSNYDIVAHTFDVTVTVSNLLPGDVTGFHIHQAPVGTNGPIIVDFTGVAPLVPSGSGFTFTATGLVLPAGSEAAFLGGATYVNIHNAAFPGGVIRGQLFSTGNVDLATGRAPGTTSITRIERVTGGAGDDSLVGSFAVNHLDGGAGADWILGGPDAGDTFIEGHHGGPGPDVFLWNSGDGTEFLDGGGDGDTLQVNGDPSAGEFFLTGQESIWFTVERVGGVAPAQVMASTLERVIVNGLGGNDVFLLANPQADPVSSLTTLNLNGFEGDDAFAFAPVSSEGVEITVDGGSGNDQLAGPSNGPVSWNVTGPNRGLLNGLVSQFSFIEVLAGSTNNDTFSVKAFPTGPIEVWGGGGSGADTLNYDAELRPVAGDTTPPDGSITSTGVQPVGFAQLETVNIVNPAPAIAISDVIVAEGSAPGSAVFTVSLTHTSPQTVTVNFATANGTAVAPGDYSAVSGTVTFFSGQTTQTVSVPIVGDTAKEPTETFFVNLSGAANATLADSQGLGTIANDDTVPDDFDGDGKTDLVVFRPASATWYTLPSSTGIAGSTTTALGLPGDLPVSGDYDGDGYIDLAAYHPADGTWRIRPSSTLITVTSAWGLAGDRPVPGDYDGDGRTDLAVYRPSSGVWYVIRSNNSTVLTVALGLSTDIPVPADYDGDGRTDVAVYRPSTGRWSIRKSGTGGPTSLGLQWGVAGDVPVPGDYDGDRRADVAVFRPSNGMWFLLRSTTGFTTSTALGWGGPGDLAVPADYDGDRLADIAIFRPGTGTWHLLKSSTNFTTADAIQWGLSGDVPIPGAPIRRAIVDTGGQATRSTLANLARESDFDADARADITVWSPSTGIWSTRQSSTGYATSTTFQWGLNGDVPAPGDYDGDGTTDLMVWRPGTGQWFLRESSAGFAPALTIPWGLNGDVPVPGDYDGDGRADYAVYRPANGMWFIRSTSAALFASYQWGLSSDVAVPGDYDGDGFTDLAVWRPSTGEWYVRQSSSGYTTSVTHQWGLPGDVAVPGDYDGDGRTDFAVFRPSTGTWFVTQSTTGATTFTSYQLGASGDTPVAGDYDGDGRTDLAVFRPSNGLWSILTSTSGFTTTFTFTWGNSTDIPILRRPY